jgi:REP element-mobilizing transposase RayT
MSRPPRIDFPGAYHHAMNRAVGHRPFFENRTDIRLFLALLAHTVRRGDLEVHAYSILTTHFHLLVRSPRGRLSAAMAWIEGRYVRTFNAKRDRPGPLVRSRFRSKRIDCLAYFSNVVRYIDANALDAGLVRRPADYPFASAAAYSGGRSPPWLHQAEVRSVTCRVTGSSAFSPSLYLEHFGVPPTAAVRIATERSIARGDRIRLALGPVAAAHPVVRARFAANAASADGMKLETPEIDVDSVELAVREAQRVAGPVIVRHGSRSMCAWTMLRIGVLRDLAGESEAAIATRLGWSRSTVRDYLARFRDDVVRDAAARNRLDDVLRRLPAAWSQPL